MVLNANPVLDSAAYPVTPPPSLYSVATFSSCLMETDVSLDLYDDSGVFDTTVEPYADIYGIDCFVKIFLERQ